MTAKNMTLGGFLNRAESLLAERGGFNAVVDCEACRIFLMYRTPDSATRLVSQACLPEGRAAEDVAAELLEAQACAANPDHLDFARTVFFPIDFRSSVQMDLEEIA